MDPLLPPTVGAVLDKFDQSRGDVDEFAVKQAIIEARSALVDPSDQEQLGAWAELLAFALVPMRTGSSPWGTYFGPLMSGTKENGETFYSPDVAGTDPEVISYWSSRARAVSHPVLQARYADLAWDMARAIAAAKPDAALARVAVDAYVGSAAPGKRSDIHAQFDAALRAIDLAVMIRDTDRVDLSRKALLELHGEAMRRGKGLWWKAFDRLVDDRRTRLAEVERDALLADLEGLLRKFSNTGDPGQFDPHAAQEVGKRLIGHYRLSGKASETSRLHEAVARAFEHAASLASPMLASTFLETSVAEFRAARLTDEAKRARVLMEEKIAASADEMTSFTFDMTITQQEMEAFLASVIVDDVGKTFALIADQFVGRRARMESDLAEIAKDAPLQAIFTQQVMAAKHVAAKIGAVDEDPLGRVIQHAAQMMALSDVYLLAALDRAVEVHSLRHHHVVAWARRTTLFRELGLVLEGVEAWFHGDMVKAVHVLIPQIEAALRAIAEELDLPSTKPHPKFPGVSVAVNMGDLLTTPGVAQALGDDITLHLRTLFTDPRGCNLRNEMAHGLLRGEQIGEAIGARLIHVLLVIGVWKELADARRASGAPAV